MIVRQFLQWIRFAPPGERAEATSALARAYLHSDLSPDDHVAGRPFAAGAARAVRSFLVIAKGPENRRPCVGRRSAGDRDAAAVAFAAAAGGRPGGSDRHRSA